MSGISTQLDDTISSISTHEKALNATILEYSFFDNPDLFNGMNIGFKMFYGVITAFAALGALAALLMAGCAVVRARMLVYCTCAFLMLMGVVSFVLAIAATYALPIMSQICAYGDRQLATPEGTYYLLSNL